MLDPSQAGSASDAPATQPFGLKALLEQVTDPFRDAAMDRELAIAVLVPPTVPRRLAGDAAELARVLGALVANAVRYAAAGRVALRVALEATDDAGVVLAFTVEDAGPAIPAPALGCPRDPAAHHDPASARCRAAAGPAGPLCRRICELPREKISLLGAPAEGVAFRWRQHFVPLPAPAPEPPPEPPPPRPGTRVLLVEDNRVSLLMASRLLARLGCQVDSAEDGRQALALFVPGRYELVLMDCEMPGMDGFAAARAIRAREAAGPRVPIVALTAYTAEEECRGCLAAGMDDHLAKPFHVADLARVLAKWAGPVAPEAPAS